MVDKINAIGYTSLLHFPNPNDKKEIVKIAGMPKEVFEKLGIAIINSESDCTEELFDILYFKLNKYGDEKFKRQLVEFIERIIKEKKMDLSDEFHELMTFHYSMLDWRGQGEMMLRYLGKDTKFAFRPIVSKKEE